MDFERSGRVSDSIYENQIEFLEKRLQNDFFTSFVHKGYLTGPDISYISKQKYNEVIQALKPQLSKRDIFIFESALLWSRIYENTIILRNSGNVMLKKIKLIVQSPLSEFSGTRKNNILNIEGMKTSNFNKIEREDEHSVIYLHDLNINGIFSVEAITKENAIQNDQIKCEYENRIVIQKKLILSWVVVLVLLLWSIRIFFSGRRKNA